MNFQGMWQKSGRLLQTCLLKTGSFVANHGPLYSSATATRMLTTTCMNWWPTHSLATNSLCARQLALVVVNFWASWAPQCEQVSDVLLELAKDKQLSNTKFLRVEAESVPEVSHKYEVIAVPTCILIKNNAVICRVDGANAPELTKQIKKHHSFVTTSNNKPANKEEDLNDRLKRLINASPVMLFMKGSPDQPKCGFSRTIVDLLRAHNIKFDSFDILTDNAVREGLKTYSDWPTYPQLYASGNLLGGLDIVREMAETGELRSSLPSSAVAEVSLDERLRTLVNRSVIIVFMKGSPETPKCGFSRTIVGILDDSGVPYDHFDILTDDEVRQGLKTFSNWPTYPQLYVKGELIGGLDIVKEMNESGELKEILQTAN